MSKDQQFKEMVFKAAVEKGYLLREYPRCHAWRMVGMPNIAVCASCLYEEPRF